MCLYKKNKMNSLAVILLPFLIFVTFIPNCYSNDIVNSYNLTNQLAGLIGGSYYCLRPTITKASCTGYNKIPDDIIGRYVVQVLDMSSGNNIEILTEGQLRRAALPMLTHLNLQNCKITKIERRAFSSGERNLVEIDLSYNRIETLDPEVFEGLANLVTLNLRRNPLKRFETLNDFPSLRLETLDLSQGQLESLTFNIFSKLTYLDTIKLNDNKLTTLDGMVLWENRYLRHLDLRDNPWNCDCKMESLLAKLREMKLRDTLFDTSCSTPANMTGMNWNFIQKDTLTCEPMGVWDWLGIVVIIVIFLIAAVGFFCIWRRQQGIRMRSQGTRFSMMATKANEGPDIYNVSKSANQVTNKQNEAFIRSEGVAPLLHVSSEREKDVAPLESKNEFNNASPVKETALDSD